MRLSTHHHNTQKALHCKEEEENSGGRVKQLKNGEEGLALINSRHRKNRRRGCLRLQQRQSVGDEQTF